MKSLSKNFVPGFVLFMLAAALLAGPARIEKFLFPSPRVPDDWKALLDDVRAFERRIGFRDTANFKVKRDQHGGYILCAYAPRLQLPYSYEDPAIRWSPAQTEQACRAGAKGEDVYFAKIEAVGEIGAAVTAGMVEGKLDRFLYLVIHEDCHDQFDFPFGFEEALCNLLSYEGMASFAREKFDSYTSAARAVRGYARTQTQLTHDVVYYYRQAEQLYARHARVEMAAAAVLVERSRLFSAAERTLGWHRHTMNNVGLANEMTYSRHFPLVEQVYRALGRDLAKTVAFFKQADKIKPGVVAVKTEHRLSDAKSAAFLRAYERALTRTVKSLLAAETGSATAGPIE